MKHFWQNMKKLVVKVILTPFQVKELLKAITNWI